MVSLNKPSLYDLFELHVEARGELATRREQALTVFSCDGAEGAVGPYDSPPENRSWYASSEP